MQEKKFQNCQQKMNLVVDIDRPAEYAVFFSKDYSECLVG